jgi:hypothetical protein
MAYIPLKQNYPTIKINREVKRGPLEYLAPLANALVAGQGMQLKSEMFAHKLSEAQRQRDLAESGRSAQRNYLTGLMPTLEPIPQDGMGFPDMSRSDADTGMQALQALLRDSPSPSNALKFAGDLQEFIDPQADASSARDQAYIRNVDSSIDSRALMDTIRQNKADASVASSRSSSVGNILDAITEALGADDRMTSYDPNWKPFNTMTGQEALREYGIDPANQDWVDLKSGPLTAEILAALGREEIPANISSRLLAAILSEYEENKPLNLLPQPTEGAEAAQSALAALWARHPNPK